MGRFKVILKATPRGDEKRRQKVKTEDLGSILLSILLVTSLMVPLLTVALISVPQASSEPLEENVKYLDNLYDLGNPVSSRLHELYPVYCRRYHLTSWIDTNGDYVLSSCDKIDITDEKGVVTWWHVDNVTITMLVENVYNIEQKMYIELDPKLFENWEMIKYSPVCTWWHEIWPVFSRWYHLSSYEYDTDPPGLSPSDIIDLTDENKVVSWWHVLEVKYDIIVQQILPPKYLDNLRDLKNPVSSMLHELYPEYCKRYHLTSWIDTNRDGELSPSDVIDMMDNENVVTWWHVDVVTITMLVENVENIRQIMYIELDPKLFPYWENIKRSPKCTMWHEVWPVFSRWYHLSSWYDENLDGVLGPCDIIDITDEESGVVSLWHVVDVKYDIIVQPRPPVTEFYKENMPDLGQHCINWCWTAAAANSIKWWAEYRGYKELLDDPSDNVPDENYLQLIPCPWVPCGQLLRLLHEIAIDCLYPDMPENEISHENVENTWCRPIDDNRYYYGLWEFIREQGAPLYVHEIVDNDHFAGHPESIPPEDGENVIYDQPTFENYKRELERCQDVLLQLDFRNAGYESYPSGMEALDHIVTGVTVLDRGPGDKWIEVADPWTPTPWPGPPWGPDHNDNENRHTYEWLWVVNEDPLTVRYTGESYGSSIVADVQVVKLIYISPAVVAENYTMDLVAGWQIIGFPLTSENMTPANLFAGVGYTMKYYVAPYGPFKFAPPTDPVELGVGYLLKLDNNKTITVTGAPVENYTMNLVAGWQIVSFPVTSASTTPANLFAGVGYTMKYYVAPYGPFKFAPPTDPVELGVGYLLKLDNNKTITIPL